jgi:Transposase DDE domain group 1
VLLWPDKTPSGREIVGICSGSFGASTGIGRQPGLRCAVTVTMTALKDFCDNRGIDFIFGLPGNPVLNRAVDLAADDIRTRRALARAPVMRGYAETYYQAKSRAKARRACVRIEATTLGLDIRFAVTNLATRSAEHIYDTLYCARAEAENLINMHKRQLVSDRSSCCSPLPNQMRLILDAGAYWLMLTMRDDIPNAHSLPRQSAAAQTRRAGHRNGFAHSACLRGSLLRRRIDSGNLPPRSSPPRHDDKGRRCPVEPLR